MNIIEELTEYFRKFPGVGPRQANRFVYYLIRINKDKKNRISDLIKDLNTEIYQCKFCNQTFLKKEYNNSDTCRICSNPNRDNSKLLIIENDTDFETIEKTSIYNGKYFIIGSLIKILDKNFQNKVFLDKLIDTIKKDENINEIIFGLDATPDGENTINIFKKEITEKINRNIKLSVLGRGLSTGTEIEYIDQETLKNALNNRT